ncbi:MAG: MFS transporter, partial [Thermocrispum sp.]
ALRGVPADPRSDHAKRLDAAGASTVTGSLLAFVYALHHAATHGWESGESAAWFVAAGVLMAVFVLIETRSAAPLVPPAALRNRSLVAANLTAFLAFGAFFSFIFLGSLLMQQVLGYSPLTTGLAWVATTTTEFAASSAAGRLAATAGFRRLLVIGLSLLAAAVGWLARVPADASYLTDLLPAFLLGGLGLGLCAPSLQIGALSGVAETEAGLASGLVETMREIGAAAGVAAISSVLVAGTGLAGFHAAFAAIAVLAVIGVGTAAGLAPRRRHSQPEELAPGSLPVSA